jgi:putative FmdB family regulatory protein
MPIYEYVCEEDGTVIEVLRPMAEADRPVEDPEGRGRTFKRRLSTFAPAGSTGAAGSPSPGGGGCCPCGRNPGSCAG